MATIDKLNEILKLITEIKEEDVALGSVLLNNFGNVINGVQAIKSGKELDINDQLFIISDILGFDFEELVKTIIEKDYGMDQSGQFVNAEEADQATVDFIKGNSDINSNEIDDYEKFLKDNMEFLKGEI